MAATLEQKQKSFRDLHRDGCFLLPNPWDIGGVRRLEKMGFKALASTSAGLAWSLGLEDNMVTRDQVLEHLAVLVGATDLPINADFENGFALHPDTLADNVILAAGTGIAGLSIEDSNERKLFEFDLSVDRIRAARKALDRAGTDVMLVARSEGFFIGRPNLEDTIARLVAYSAAGADCLYAPGVKDLHHIRLIVEAVAPKPVNVLLWGADMTFAALKAAGVRRVSTGGALAKAAWRGFDELATRLMLAQGQADGDHS